MTALLYVAISLAIASLFGNAWVAVKVWSTWPALDRDHRRNCPDNRRRCRAAPDAVMTQPPQRNQPNKS